MDWCYAVLTAVLFLLTLPSCLVSEKIINLSTCKRCSGRADVPCFIQEMHFPCAHGEFRDTWPGKPRDLSGHTVHISNDTSVLNFTWKTPYDASYSSLDGFLITLNIFMMGLPPLEPYCFLANVSGTNWKAVKDPHSVLFHFDCVTASVKMDVHMTLMSSPMPETHPDDERLQPVQKLIQYVPATERAPVTNPFKINYTVSGTTVDLTFGPLQDDFSYCVCLIISSDLHWECYVKQLLDPGIDHTSFDDVEEGTYKILIRSEPVTFNTPWYSSKAFNVSAPMVDEPEPASNTLLIVVGTLCGLLVIVAGTIVVFSSSKMNGHRVWCKKLLLCANASGQQNSLSDEEWASLQQSEYVSPELIPLFMNESQSFTAAVSCVCNYIGQATKCHINFQCSYSEQLHLVQQKGRDSICVIFLSKEITPLLKDDLNVPPMGMDFQREETQMREILMTIKGKQFRYFMISFSPTRAHELSPLNHRQIFDLSCHPWTSVTKKNFEMNLSKILKLVSGHETLPVDWVDNEQLQQVQRMISAATESVCTNNCPIPLSGNCRQSCLACLAKYRFDIESEQKDLDVYPHDQLREEDFQNNTYDDLLEGLAGLQSSNPLLQKGLSGYGNTGNWEPEAPDSDVESDSYSVLCQKEAEINRNYMTTLNEEHTRLERNDLNFSTVT